MFFYWRVKLKKQINSKRKKNEEKWKKKITHHEL